MQAIVISALSGVFALAHFILAIYLIKVWASRELIQADRAIVAFWFALSLTTSVVLATTMFFGLRVAGIV
jgi:hypothetical protein